jgi:hypothetical protein
MGQLGVGHLFTVFDPQSINGLRNSVARITAGDAFSVALKTDGTVWAFGSNNAGQLGLLSASALLPSSACVDSRGCAADVKVRYTAPQQVLDLGCSVARVAVGAEHTLVIKGACTQEQSDLKHAAFDVCECTLCPVGLFAPPAQQQTAEETAHAAPSVTCREGSVIDIASCVPCAQGRYAHAEGSPICHTCVPGYVSSSRGASDCEICGPGKFQPSSEGTACIQCPRGKYLSAAGARSDECTFCALGSVVSVGAGSCELCKKGSYGTVVDSVEFRLGCYTDSELVHSKRICRADEPWFCTTSTVRARPRRLSGISVSRRESVLYGAFVWARGALNRPKRRFPTRAVLRRRAVAD